MKSRFYMYWGLGILALILALVFITQQCQSQTPGTYEWRYAKGYLSNKEIKDNLCCPCDAQRLADLKDYSARKGITQRVDRQYYLIGHLDHGVYTPITNPDIAILLTMIPTRPEYPKLLLDPEMWRYEQEYIQSLIDSYHASLTDYMVRKDAFYQYVQENYMVFKAYFVHSACSDYYKVGTLAVVWNAYEGEYEKVYLNKLFDILSGSYTRFQDTSAKIRTPVKLSASNL